MAKTQAQAQRAAKMVKITYEELPKILTIEVNNWRYLYMGYKGYRVGLLSQEGKA